MDKDVGAGVGPSERAQTVCRSFASSAKEIGARSDRAGAIASCSPMRLAISATRVNARFSLQLARHEAVQGIGGVVLTKGPVGGVARRLEIARHGLARLVTPNHGLRLGSEGRLRRGGLYDGEQRCLDGIIHAQAAEGDAVRLAVVESTAKAGVAGDLALGTGVPRPTWRPSIAARRRTKSLRRPSSRLRMALPLPLELGDPFLELRTLDHPGGERDDACQPGCGLSVRLALPGLGVEPRHLPPAARQGAEPVAPDSPLGRGWQASSCRSTTFLGNDLLLRAS